MLKSETIGDKELQKQRVRERYNERADPDKMFVIPATEQPINIYEDDQQRRVAVYVRVSTDSVQQTSSYELQKNYYTSFVESHPNWVLVHIYADEGISGTSLNHRDEFNAMIADCERGKIDLIVTKSVSRFARNIVDCISMVRRLRALRPSVGVYFEAEHIFTLKNDTDMSLAFTATMAEEESHTKSTIMNMSVQMRFGLGKYLTPTLLGYKHDENGNLIINEDEAPIVRLIFFMYLFGYTCQQIADHLTMLQVKTRKGKDRWSSGTIVQVLRNERHCGDIRAGKTFTPDFHTHRSVKNRGERPIYGMYDHHEPIISRDDFIAVQQKLNNAKYGNKGILPELRVVREGVLTGFVSINPHWAGFSEKDYCDASLSEQIAFFNEVIHKASINNRKVLSIHSRGAVKEVLQTLESNNGNYVPVLHWFTGKIKEAEKAIELGCWFSINPKMCFTETGKKIIKCLPLDRILPETDAPFVQINGAPYMPWDTTVTSYLARENRLEFDYLNSLLHKNLDHIINLVQNN